MDECFETFGDDVGVRQFVFVREGFPSGVEERGGAGFEPGGEVGVEPFLGLEAVGDDEERAGRVGAVELGGEVGLGAGGDTAQEGIGIGSHEGLE